MSERMYVGCRVSADCYVDSQCHYHFRAVVWRRVGEKRKRVKVEYMPDFGSTPALPRYSERLIEQQIIRLHAEGKLTFYEKDRDENKRREDFWYYDPGEWAEMVAQLAINWVVERKE
jgi:hypothetical protein